MTENPTSRRGRLRMFTNVPSRVRWLIYLASISTIGYGYWMVAITAYLPEMGFTGTDAGLLFFASGIAFVVTAIPIGIYADRAGKKSMFIVCLICMPPTLLVYAFTTDMVILFISAVVAGICEGGFMATWNAMIADQTTLENRNDAFSLSFIISNAALGLGMAMPFTFPFVQDVAGITSEQIHNWCFILLALVGWVSPILLIPLFRNYHEEKHPPMKWAWTESKGHMLKFSGVNSMIGLGAGFIIPLLPTWLLYKFAVPDSISGPLLAISMITIGVAAITSSKLAKKHGMVRAIVMTQGFSMVFMFALAFVPNAWIGAVVMISRAALMNMSSPIADSYLMGIVMKEERALASSVNSLVWRLPFSVTTPIGGALLDSGDYATPFYLATIFYIISIVLFYKIFKNITPRS